MTNKRVILATSATPLSMKKAILTEEGLRRLKSCCPSLPWSHKVEVMTDYNWWLMVSGHSETFRVEITNRILSKYEQLLANDKQKVCPFYRSKIERQKQKQENKLKKTRSGWFTSQGFSGVLRIDPTPGGELAKRIKRRLSREKLRKGVKILVQESMGISLRSLTSNSADPFTNGHCSRQKCFMCNSTPGGSAGNCWKSKITYALESST